MNKKYICCVHDKKSDTYESFMMFDNMSQAMRTFQTASESNDIFKKWPEDFDFILVCEIQYTSGEMNEEGKIIKEAGIEEIKKYNITVARVIDFVQINKAKKEKEEK